MSGRGRTAPPPPPPRRDSGGSDLLARVVVAVPAALFAIFLVASGGLVFALGVGLLGCIALHELYNLMRRARPIDLAGYATVIALVVVALYEPRASVLIPLAAAFPVTFILALTRARLDNIAWGMSATIFGIAWIGIPLAHAVFLRELPHGDGLVVDVLIATFLGDTAAYGGGRLWGRNKLAPDLSPNKTIEGLAAGIVGGTLAFWAAGLYQDWLSGFDALLLGFLVALAAPLGDLFESAIKRDLDVKDTGRFFGAHGGVLDRLDAVLFTVVVAFYVALALGYG
jgi:phosphatidate cytidylyltransferase